MQCNYPHEISFSPLPLWLSPRHFFLPRLCSVSRRSKDESQRGKEKLNVLSVPRRSKDESQRGKEKLRYETKEGSYLSEKEKLLLLFVCS